MEEIKKKYLILIIGIALGFVIGVWGVSLWNESFYVFQRNDFQKNGKAVNVESIEVIEVYGNGRARVNVRDDYWNYMECLLIDGAESELYDGLEIKVPKRKTVKMHGTYQYTTSKGRVRTIPKIMIVDQ